MGQINSIKVVMQGKSIGHGQEVTQHGWAKTYSWSITIIILQILEFSCGNYLKGMCKHKNTDKRQLLASNLRYNQPLIVYENFIPQNEPYTQLIDATSFV